MNHRGNIVHILSTACTGSGAYFVNAFGNVWNTGIC